MFIGPAFEFCKMQTKGVTIVLILIQDDGIANLALGYDLFITLVGGKGKRDIYDRPAVLFDISIDGMYCAGCFPITAYL